MNAVEEFVAKRLRELRARHELTQEQAAMLLGTDVKWYQRVEWSAKDLRASTIDRLASVFGITVVEFLAKEVPEATTTADVPAAPHKPRRPKSRGAATSVTMKQKNR